MNRAPSLCSNKTPKLLVYYMYVKVVYKNEQDMRVVAQKMMPHNYFFRWHFPNVIPKDMKHPKICVCIGLDNENQPMWFLAKPHLLCKTIRKV